MEPLTRRRTITLLLALGAAMLLFGAVRIGTAAQEDAAREAAARADADDARPGSP